VTSSPYVPSGGGQDQDPQTSEWSAGSTGAGQPVTDPAAPYDQYAEPVTTGYEAGSTAVGGYGQTSTTSATADAAKGEANDLKNTAVDKGQQVAGVAKEQAGAVKDTAVENAQHVAGVAKEQAGAVKDTALENAQQVAGVAKDEVGKVVGQATGQAKDLLNQGRAEISSQLVTQQQRLGSLVHSFADELGTMASKSDKSGPVTDLAQEGSRRIGALAHTLETAEPSDLLEQVRNFARRRPVAFLVGSALAGVVVGRLSRSLAADAHDTKVANETPALPASTYSTPASTYSTPASTYATTGTTGYETGATTGGYETGSYDTGYSATRAYDDDVTYVQPGQGDLPR
jgi:uncharacterized protein YjbJ (UPF0337 family)